MKVLTLSRYALGTCASIVFLAACSGGERIVPSWVTQPIEPVNSTKAFGTLNPWISGSHLYVVNDGGNTVTVYGAGSGSVLRTITQGLFVPYSLAFDSSGNLYVANNRNVTVYATGSTNLIRTITNGIGVPSRLAFDQAGNLFVANVGQPSIGGNTVTVYAPGSMSPLRTITQGIDGPQYLAFDSNGNLYVANNLNNTVTVYAGGKNRLSRTITDGLRKPAVLAFDAARNLFVANSGG